MEVAAAVIDRHHRNGRRHSIQMHRNTLELITKSSKILFLYIMGILNVTLRSLSTNNWTKRICQHYTDCRVIRSRVSLFCLPLHTNTEEIELELTYRRWLLNFWRHGHSEQKVMLLDDNVDDYSDTQRRWGPENLEYYDINTARWDDTQKKTLPAKRTLLWFKIHHKCHAKMNFFDCIHAYKWSQFMCYRRSLTAFDVLLF